MKPVLTTRRAFLKEGSLFLLTVAATELPCFGEEKPRVTAALVTDVHFADADARGNRFYRESLTKMREMREVLAPKKPDLVIEGGDFVDSASKAVAADEIRFLKTINQEFVKISSRRAYVCGNHCATTLTKKQFLDTVGQETFYFSLNQNGVHFVFLDACYRRDGVPYGAGNFEWTDTDINLPQQEWLEADLKTAKGPVLVFVHQRLDLNVGHEDGVYSSPRVREILEQSGKVRAVFMGHSHANDYKEINGIAYIALAAMVDGTGPENSGYSLLHVLANGTLRLDGFRQHGNNPFVKRV